MQLVLYDGRPAAVAGATRVWLAPEVDALPRGHPVARFVAAMCLYARDVHEELVPGPAPTAMRAPSSTRAACCSPTGPRPPPRA